MVPGPHGHRSDRDTGAGADGRAYRLPSKQEGPSISTTICSLSSNVGSATRVWHGFVTCLLPKPTQVCPSLDTLAVEFSGQSPGGVSLHCLGSLDTWSPCPHLHSHGRWSELCWLKLRVPSNNKSKCCIYLPAWMHWVLYFIRWSRQPGNLNESFYILEKVSVLHPFANKYTHIYAHHTPDELPEHSRCEVR